MVDNSIDDVLDIAESTYEALNHFVIPISTGIKAVNDEGVTEELIDAWTIAQQGIFDLIEETELAIALDEDEEDLDDEDVD